MPNNKPKLPQNIQDYLFAMKATDYNIAICKKHGLAGKNIGKHTSIISALYYKELALADLIKKLMDTFKLDETKAKALATDIAGIKLLAIEKWLEEDIKTYINNLGGTAEDYIKYVAALDAAITLEKEEEELENKEEEILETELNKKPAPTPNIKAPATPPTVQKEKKEAVELFKEGLAGLLAPQAEDFNEIIKDFNNDLIEWLYSSPNFKRDLEDALYKNNELLTNADFYYNGEQHNPTIGAWVKDFIKQFGSKNFGDIDLTRFVTNSRNTKNLNSEEKKLVAKVIKMYRYIKFFPESMPSDTGDGWEIIPIERSISDAIRPTTKKVVAPEPIELKKAAMQQATAKLHKEEKAIEKEQIDLENKLLQEELAKPKKEITEPEVKQNEENPIKPKQPPTKEEIKPQETIEKITFPDPISVGQQKPTESTESSVPPQKTKPKNPRAKELLEMAAMYPKGSIERKAIEDEIEKL